LSATAGVARTANVPVSGTGEETGDAVGDVPGEPAGDADTCTTGDVDGELLARGEVDVLT
jgi:hypothetical protein